MKGVIQILIGLIIVVGLIWLTFFSDSIWPRFQDLLWKSVYTVFVGGIAWVLLLIAIALIVVGFSDLGRKD